MPLIKPLAQAAVTAPDLIATTEDTPANHARCIVPSAQAAEKRLRFPSSHAKIVPFIVAIATSHRDQDVVHLIADRAGNPGE